MADKQPEFLFMRVNLSTHNARIQATFPEQRVKFVASSRQAV